MNRNISIPLGVSAVIFLMSSAFSAYAAPTEREITQARGDCHAHKVRVKALERNASKNASSLVEERAAWVRSCAKASAMMEGKEAAATPSADSSTASTSADSAVKAP